jgi:hypothetical protein
MSIFSNFHVQPCPSENSYGEDKAKENIDIGSIKNRYVCSLNVVLCYDMTSNCIGT